MASVPRILLAAGLIVAVVTAAPQLLAPHPLAEAHRDTLSFENKTLTSDHSVSQSKGSNISNTENPNKSGVSNIRETRGTQSKESDEETVTTTEGCQDFNNNPHASFGLSNTRKTRDVSVDQEIPGPSIGETAPPRSQFDGSDPSPPSSSFGHDDINSQESPDTADT